jgi:hypothetical protein
MSNPDQIERDAAQSRDALAQDVSRLNDKVSPASFLQRRKGKLQETGGSIKDKLMGSSDSAGAAAKDKAGSAVSSMKDATDSLGSKVTDAVSADALKQQTQGNPIAAGLIAFGVGWLLSSLVPVSSAEQDVAKKVEDSVGEPLKQSAREVAENLQEPLQESAHALKSTATDAANKTVEQAKSTANDVKANAQEQARR